jgi:hypothetical protein
MRVLLHIGTEKTGTTTIQRFLKINAEKLRGHGILIPTSPCQHGVSHIKLSAYARRDNRSDDVRLRLGIKAINHFRRTFAQNFLKECYDAGCDTIILSSEHCSSRLLFDDEIARLRDLLAGLGPVQIILYLRRQDEMWASHYSTAVKSRSTDPISLPTSHQKKELLDYQGLCTRWATLFGAGNLHVRIFDRREFIRGDLLDDFVATAGMQVDISALSRPPSQNIGLDPELLEFLRRFNYHLPHVSAESKFRPDPRQGNLLTILEKLTARSRRRILPPLWSKMIMEEFADGNSKVAKAFLGREDGRLFRHDWSEEIVAGEPPPFTLDDAFQIFARIWVEKNRPGSTAGKVPPVGLA